VKLWLRKLKGSDDRGALQEVSYTAHTRYGCIRFEHALIKDVCDLVLGLVAGV